MSRPIKPGTIVKVKTGGLAARRGSPAYFLAMRGSGVRLLTDAAIAEALRRQISVPTLPIPPFAPMRLRLAYGVWTEADGTRVLFSRDYFPLWRIPPNGPAVPDDPWRWVEFVDEQWFWDNGHTPWRNSKLALEVEERMRNMGIDGFPKLMDAVQILIRNPALGIRDAVRLMVPPGEEMPPHLTQ